MAISDLFPVVSTIQPNLLETVISTLPRMRACTFSSATLGVVPEKCSASISVKAMWAGSMGISQNSMPRLRASSAESSMLPLDE